MKTKKINKILEKIEIIDTSSEGMAVGKHEDLVVFVKGAVPGDIVDVTVKKLKKFCRRSALELDKGFSTPC